VNSVRPGNIRFRLALTVALLTACGVGADDARQSVPLPAQDSLATAREVQLSLTGARAPGAQAYSFRGLYAGMSRSELEAAAPPTVSADSVCHKGSKLPVELACGYVSRVSPDSAPVRIDVEYATERGGSALVARSITVTRELPLDVDGVMLARLLSDAFAEETALLDRRESAYGHHAAQVRMGTLNGAKENFVDLAVAPRLSREVLTVTMRRAENSTRLQPRQVPSAPVGVKRSPKS
jgi:hypothetical protein